MATEAVSTVSGLLGIQTQIASVMEVFANAAVAEICKIMERTYTHLHSDMLKSQSEKNELHMQIVKSQRENNLLKRRLKLMEMRESFYKRANKLKEASGIRTNNGRVRVRINSVQTQQHSTDEPVQNTFIASTHQECVMENTDEREESNVLFLKREQMETINKNEDLEMRNKESSGIVVHDHQQCDETEYLKEEVTEEQNKPANNGSGSEEVILSAEAEHDMTVADAPWEDDMFNSPVHSLNYTGADTNAGASADDYLLQRDAVRTYDSELNLQVDQQPEVAYKADHYAVCKYCGKHFPHASALVLHQRIHTGEKPYFCALCGKRFGQASSLKKHYSMHRGEKPFSCSHCGKLFSDQSNLKKHVNVHTGAKPYACTQCGKTFNQSSNLKTHMKIHTREKPFTCEHCGHIFAYKSSLVKHQQRNCLLQNPSQNPLQNQTQNLLQSVSHNPPQHLVQNLSQQNRHGQF